MSLIKDFKSFAMRGNVIDLAVAVVIGVAFGRIVTSLVNDLLMPPIGMLLGGIDFTEFIIILREATQEAEAVTINYGIFIQNVVDFIIVALAIFMVVRVFEQARKKEAEKPAAPPELTGEEILLKEIRDILKAK